MRLSRAAVVGATVLVVAGGGYAAYAENADTGTSYRTAAVVTADVEQTLALSGTVSPAGRGDLAFTTSGTVAAVRVKVGQHVRAGQVLARLNRASLTAAVTRAQAQLDSAKARLASDEDAQASAASSSTTTPAVPASAATPHAASHPSASPNPAGGTESALLSQIRQQQTAVTTSQTAASTALSDARTALAEEEQACAATASASASASDPTTAGSSGQPGDSSTSSSSDGSACGAGIDAVQAAQTKVDEAQSQLQHALDSLATTLSSAASQSGSQGAQAATASQQPSRLASSSGPSSSGPSSSASNPSASKASGGSGRTVTAATLASDQANIDSARASLVSAQQSLSGATLRASRAGKVGEVDMAAGDAASAGTTAITVLSPGATDVDLSVTSTQVAKLKVGQAAEVTPAGATKALPGTVARITPVPDSNGDYPVTVTLGQAGLDLPAGGTAAVDVVVGKATGVLTVPTSAVSNGTVEVLDGTTITRTRVTVGVVGTTRTQISSGLTRGQEVVLADIDAAVPTSNQQSGFGRFGGAGLGGSFGGGPAGGGFRAPGGGSAVPKG